MKKISLLVAALIVTTAFSTFDLQAQQNRGDIPRGNAQRAPRMFSAEDRVASLKDTLNLTDEQQTKLKELFESQGKEMQELMQKTDLSQAERRAAMEKFLTSSNEQIKKILNEEQFKKYQERTFRPNMGNNRFDARNARAPMTSEERAKAVQKAISITDEQTTKLKEYYDSLETSMKEMREKMRSLSADERLEYLKKSRETEEAKLKEILGDKYEAYDKVKNRLERPQMRPSENGARGPMTVERRIENLTKALNLNEEQQKKMTELYKEQEKNAQALREKLQNLSREERQAQMKTSREELNTKIKEILGENLFKKYTEYQAQNQRAQRGQTSDNSSHRKQRGRTAPNRASE